MRTVLETITPELAAEYLLRNKRNRPMSDRHVSGFVKSINAGEFQLTHQGIAFFEDGSLADGQHRLKAIVLSGKSVQMIVTYGVPFNASTSIDTQLRLRSYSDALTIEGNDLAKKQTVACVRTWLALEGNRRPALFEVRNFLELHHQSIDTAVQIAGGNQTLKHACFLCMIAIACEQGHAEQIREWAEAIKCGIVREEWQTSAIRMREWWLANSHNGGSDQRKQLCHRIYSSMLAWLEKRGLAKLYVRDRIDWLDKPEKQ